MGVQENFLLEERRLEVSPLPFIFAARPLSRMLIVFWTRILFDSGLCYLNINISTRMFRMLLRVHDTKPKSSDTELSNSSYRETYS